MSRSFISAALAGVALLIVTSLAFPPDPARGAEPDVAAFVEAARAAGQTCEERSGGSHCSDWPPAGTNLDPPFSFTQTRVEKIGAGLGVAAMYDAGNHPELVPLDAAAFAYFDRLVTIALGDDQAAHAWLAEMNAGPKQLGSLVRGDRRLEWRADLGSLRPGVDNEITTIILELWLPGDVPTSPGASGGSGPASPHVAPGDRGAGGTAFEAAVARPHEVSTDPAILLQSAALAALLVLLMPFPSQLFNSTLEKHEHEVRRWLRLDRLGAVAGGLGRFWSSWPGVVTFTLLAALLYGFLDPGFGLDVGSLATFAGMLVGIVLVTAAFSIPVVLAHRKLGDRWRVKVVPVSLLVGIACVLISRLTGFQPGYLYGLLLGLAFARELSAEDEGRASASAAVVMLGVASLAWLGLGAVPDGEAFGLVVLRTSLAALMVAGLEGVVFGLLPMRFLPGEPLFAWDRILWGALLGVGAFAFFHILINPASGYLADSSRTPLLTIVALLVGFSLVSVGFWAWFRFRSSSPPGPPGHPNVTD